MAAGIASPIAFWLGGAGGRITPGGGSPLVAPVLSHPSSTTTSIDLEWDDATGGTGSIRHDLYRNGVVYALDVVSPYTASTGLSQNTVYSWTVKATDDLTTVTSNAVAAALEYDGTGSGGGGGVLGTITRQFGQLDFYKGDAFTRALIYEPDEDWPSTISTAHLYAQPTDDTLDGDSDAQELDGIECVVDVATGDDRQVTISLTPAQTATLTAGRRGVAGYTWWVIANKDGVDQTLRSGTMTVRARPTA